MIDLVALTALSMSTTHDFEIEYEGKIYKCHRIVYGSQVLSQWITVVGKGSKKDEARYDARRGHPISGMPGAAELIAVEILQGRL